MLQVDELHAPLFAAWIESRGGVAVWRSLDLSDPTWSVSTPALTEDGAPMPRPDWKAGNTPAETITDPSAIEVVAWREVKRFRVAVRRGGLKFVLTDGATRKLRHALAKAGKDATYTFDYATQEAVVSVPEAKVTLTEWLAARPAVGGRG